MINQINDNLIKEKSNHLYLSDYKIEYMISVDDSIIISKWIKDENKKNGKHMLEKSPKDIFMQSNDNFCCKITKDNNLIGFINAMNVEYNGFYLLESGSIIVHPNHQNRGIGHLLKKELLNKIEEYGEKPVYSISNQMQIMKINKKLNQKKYTKEEVPKQILEVMESAGKLLEDDSIYINKSLFNLFNEHQNDKNSKTDSYY